MRAEYDSTADAISIVIAEVPHADRSEEVHPRGIVALADGKPIGRKSNRRKRSNEVSLYGWRRRIARSTGRSSRTENRFVCLVIFC